MALTIGDESPEECTKVDTVPVSILSFGGDGLDLAQNVPETSEYYLRPFLASEAKDVGTGSVQEELEDEHDFVVCNVEEEGELHPEPWGERYWPMHIYAGPGTLMLRVLPVSSGNVSWRGGQTFYREYFGTYATPPPTSYNHTYQRGFNWQGRDPLEPPPTLFTPPNDRLSLAYNAVHNTWVVNKDTSDKLYTASGTIRIQDFLGNFPVGPPKPIGSKIWPIKEFTYAYAKSIGAGGTDTFTINHTDSWIFSGPVTWDATYKVDVWSYGEEPPPP